MAGTIQGGIKTAASNKAKDPDFYRRIGKLGGQAPTTKPKGFAANPELARRAGIKGGTISRRGSKNGTAKVKAEDTQAKSQLAQVVQPHRGFFERFRLNHH